MDILDHTEIARLRMEAYIEIREEEHIKFGKEMIDIINERIGNNDNNNK